MKRSLGAKTLVYPAPAFVVGSYDKDGNPNIMTAAWAGICCSKPPCVTVSLRKATYTYHNLMATRAYTLNIANEDQVKVVDYAGIASGRNEDKFKTCGLTPIKSDLVNAPYIQEFPVILECQIIHTHELGLHTMFVGEIRDVKTEESILSPDGVIEIEKLKPIIYAPGDQNYYSTGKQLARAFSIGKELSR